LPTDRISFIRDQLRRSLEGPAWHGPSLLEAIGDLTAAEAAITSGNSHSIAEIAAHALAWTEEVTRRLTGVEPDEPERGDWPRLGWKETLRLLRSAADDLDRRLALLDDPQLSETPWGDTPNPPLGTGVSLEAMLLGLAQHNAYHGGQISLLRKSLGK
jgi:uncharacterized damage-inducible protein DinB